MVVLENSFLRVQVSPVGAELFGFYDKKRGTELLWQRNDPWHNTSPLLFPVIGACYQNQYRWEDAVYSMPKHGFVRRSSFSVVSLAVDAVLLSFTDTRGTKALYPFPFCFQAAYALYGNRLECRFRVMNPGQGILPFQLGYHPGFRFCLSDLPRCFIRFGRQEPQIPWLADSRQLNLADLPKNGHSTCSAEGFLSQTVTLTTPQYRATVGIGGFSRLAIWRKDPDTPFVCIEPQVGGGDNKNEMTDLIRRKGVVILDPGEEFTVTSWIVVE